MKTRVLVIDDDTEYLEAIEYYLTSNGFSVLSTAEPKQAMALAAQFQPHIVMVDLHFGPSEDAEATGDSAQVHGIDILEDFFMDAQDRVLAVVSGFIDSTTWRNIHNMADVFCEKIKVTDPTFIAELHKAARFRFPELNPVDDAPKSRPH